MCSTQFFCGMLVRSAFGKLLEEHRCHSTLRAGVTSWSLLALWPYRWSGQKKIFADITGGHLARWARFYYRIPFDFCELMKCTSCIGENEEMTTLLDLLDTFVMKYCSHKNLPIEDRKGIIFHLIVIPRQSTSTPFGSQRNFRDHLHLQLFFPEPSQWFTYLWYYVQYFWLMLVFIKNLEQIEQIADLLPSSSTRNKTAVRWDSRDTAVTTPLLRKLPFCGSNLFSLLCWSSPFPPTQPLQLDSISTAVHK